MSFEVTILGSSGGPIDGHNCSLLIKPAQLSYHDIVSNNLAHELVCFDAGSGSGSLSEIIYREQKFRKKEILGPKKSRLSDKSNGNVELKQSRSRNFSSFFRKYKDQFFSCSSTTTEKGILQLDSGSSETNISTRSSFTFSEYSTSITATSKLHQFSSGSLSTASNALLNLYHDSMPLHQYITAHTTTPFTKLTEQSPYTYAIKILELIGFYCISHPHLDHILSLVINSAGFNSSNPKQVCGLPSTIDALNKHIFNDIIWPNLTDSLIDFKPVEPYKLYKMNDLYNLTSFEISHGENSNHCKYTSTSFLLNYLPTNSFILLFGDFESDFSSGLNKNEKIWKHVAPLIISRSLKSIVLECSNSNSTSSSEPLYGHLTPQHLIGELLVLRDEILKAQYEFQSVDKVEKDICCDTKEIYDTSCPLEGINVLVTHIKESKDNGDPRKKILHQLNDMSKEFGMKVNFSIAFPGITYVL